MKLVWKPEDLSRALAEADPTGVPRRHRGEPVSNAEQRTPITATEFAMLRDRGWKVEYTPMEAPPQDPEPPDRGPADLGPAPHSDAAFGSERVRFYRPRYYVQYVQRTDGKKPHERHLVVEWEKDVVLHNRRVPI